MNLEELTKGHCYSQGQLQYNQPMQTQDSTNLVKKYENTIVKAYCLVNASNCPFYSLLGKDSYCTVSDDWLQKRK